MKGRTKFYIVSALLLVCLINILAYTSIIKISSSMLSKAGKLDLTYIAPLNYLKYIKGLQMKPVPKYQSKNQLQDLASDKAYDFVQAAFRQDDGKLKELLHPSAKYIRSKDGSGFIRHIENGIHVEGYMASDKKLIKTKKRWCIEEDDNTITCCMEVYIEGVKSPQLWYLHFRELKGDWKIYMLENDI